MSADRMSLIMGELVGRRRPQLHPLPCEVPGVTARQAVQKYGTLTIEQRLYECANGWALGARRGGPLHLADRQNGTWELFVLTPQRFASGGAVGWIDEQTLLASVEKLASWWDEPSGPTVPENAS